MQKHSNIKAIYHTVNALLLEDS